MAWKERRRFERRGRGNELAADGTSVWILASGLADLPSNISDPSTSNILPSAACLVVIKRIAAGRQRRLGSWQRQALNFMYIQIIDRREASLSSRSFTNLPDGHFHRFPTHKLVSRDIL